MTTQTIQSLLATHAVSSSGFPAIAGLGALSSGTEPAILSSFPAAALYSQGIRDYYTLLLPRGSQFNTSQEIFDANVPVQHWAIKEVETDGLPVVLTTQHQATLDILSSRYPDAEVVSQRNADGSPRNLTAADVAGKHVIGVLPPFLVAAAAAFTSASIRDYNAAVDGDLSAEELEDRLQIAQRAIHVSEIE